MANETFILGEGLVLSIKESSTYEPIACLTSNSINSTVEVESLVTKCDPGNTVQSPGAFSYELDGEGVYIDTTSAGGDSAKQSHDKLFALQQAKTLITWKMDSGLADTPAYYGTGYITDLSLDAEAEGNATFSFTISGVGAVGTTAL